MEEAIVRPVIMSGGAGTRLWPLSRQTFPKQLLPIAAEESMLQATAARVHGAGFSAPLIVASEEHRFFVKRQLEDAGVGAAAILLEPIGRNTATVAAVGFGYGAVLRGVRPAVYAGLGRGAPAAMTPTVPHQREREPGAHRPERVKR